MGAFLIKAYPDSKTLSGRTARALMLLAAIMPPLLAGCLPKGDDSAASDSTITSTPTYTVGGTVSGLNGSVTLQNNGGDSLVVSASGSFAFATALASGASYSVTVASQPSGQTCSVSNGSGTIASSNVTSVLVSCGAGFTVAGQVTYDWVPALATNEGGPKLGYSAKSAKPARRVLVQAIDNSTGNVLSQTTTDDSGNYTMTVPSGATVKVRASARLTSTAYAPDSVAPNNCNGASWDVRAVDNTQSKALYTLESSSTYSSSSSAANLHAALAHSGTAYSSRAAAPFALLDTVVSELELVCQGAPSTSFPKLYINWSPNNIPASGNKAQGRIGTSHYTQESESGVLVSNIYILGQENVDTDEYDDHVIAHELGHYIENEIYRSDSIGSSHSLNDVLDARVAFGEGYGNAVSAMVFNDPYYVDTSGSAQSTGFTLNISQAPTGNDRGIFSERSVQYLLWSLYENRDGTSQSGSFDRIFNILGNYQRTTPAFTTAQSFAAYYNQVYGGSAENLSTLWSSSLATPYNSLCSGSCNGTGDTADPFDLDNDIGISYASASKRADPSDSSSAFGAEFWRLYRTLASGANSATAHDQTYFGSYDDPYNKVGGVRWYRYVGTGSAATISVSSLGGGASCTSDVMDLYVTTVTGAAASTGGDESSSGSTAGCPSVTFSTQSGKTYLIWVQAYGSTEISSWTVNVSP